MSLLRSLENLSRCESHLSTKKLLRIILLSWGLFTILMMLPAASQFWGPEAFTVDRGFDTSSWVYWVGNLLSHPWFSPYYKLFLLGQIVALICGIVGLSPRLSIAATLFFTVNLGNKAVGAGDGGDNLYYLMLVYMLAMNTSGRPIQTRWQTLNLFLTSLSNVSFLMARLQLCVVYLFAGLCKVSGELWQNGTAIFYIMQSDYFSTPFYSNLFFKFPFISAVFSLSIICFQISFPFLIWNRKFRWGLIIFGILFHGGIIASMRLVSFGLVMIGSYAVFFPDSTALWLLGFFSNSPKRRSDASFA